jgi:hypothetical protein
MVLRRRSTGTFIFARELNAANRVMNDKSVLQEFFETQLLTALNPGQVCVYVYVCMYVCVYMCVYMCVYVYMCVCVYVCICVCMCVYLYVCVYMCVYVCVCVCMCVYVSPFKPRQGGQGGQVSYSLLLYCYAYI